MRTTEMQESSSGSEITFLEPGIGFGHQTYSRIVTDELANLRPSPEITRFNLLNGSPPAIHLPLWFMRQVYQAAGNDTIGLYGALRGSVTPGSISSRMLDELNKGISEWIGPDHTTLVTSHAYFWGNSDNHGTTILLDGDVNPEAMASRPGITVLVPTYRSQESLLAQGKDPGEVKVIGLLVPRVLQDIDLERASQQRLDDCGKTAPLRISFLLSGQYPRTHVQVLYQLISELEPYFSYLNPRPNRLHLAVYAGTNRNLALLIARNARMYAPSVSLANSTEIPFDIPGITVYAGESPEEAIGDSFDIAAHTDIILTMANERWPWTVARRIIPLVPMNPKSQGNHEYLAEQRILPPEGDIYANPVPTNTITNAWHGSGELQDRLDRAREIFRFPPQDPYGSSRAAETIMLSIHKPQI